MKANKQRALHLDKVLDKTPPNQVHRTPRDANVQTASSTSTVVAPPTDGRLTQQNIIQLQSTHGNQAVARMIAQRKAKDASVRRLPDQIEGAMGSMFDVNLSEVGIHTDGQADKVAREAQTDATTIGNDIYFQQGAYRPGTADGNALIAREVSHIQRAKMTGSPNRGSSATASASDKDDAQSVAGIVQDMGSNPAEVLKPANGPDNKPSKAQRHVLQRDYEHSRTAGVVTSKVLQGIFTTVLGPIGLVWRWPLIQKNMGEALGSDLGYFESKKRNKDPVKGAGGDEDRYGGGALGAIMRFLSVYSEILKEMVIWLGFATFLTAVITAATHGAAAPVFLGLGIATAMVAGVLFLMKTALVGMNTYRWNKARKALQKDPTNKYLQGKLAFIKHQLVTDGLDAFGALLTAVFAGLGAGGVTSAGGALAGAAGYGSSDSATKLVGSGMTMATQGLGTSIINNTLKEGGKEGVKPGSEKGFFGQKVTTDDKGNKKRDWGGFGKDALVIYKAYGGDRKKNNQGQQDQGGGDSSIVAQVKSMDSDITNASKRNSSDQDKDLKLSQNDLIVLSDVKSPITQSAQDSGKLQDNLKDVEAKGKDYDPNKDVDKNKDLDEKKVEQLTDDTNKGLEQVGESPVGKEDDSSEDDVENDVPVTAKPTPTTRKRAATRTVQRGIGDRIKNWFSSKMRRLKKGISRLNAKILQGVMKFIMKFKKVDVNPQQTVKSLNEEYSIAQQDEQAEEENSELFEQYGDNAGQLHEGIGALAEQEQ